MLSLISGIMLSHRMSDNLTSRLIFCYTKGMKLGRFLVWGLVSITVLGGLVTLTNAQTTIDKEAARAKLQTELETEERAIAEQTKLLVAKQKDTATVAGEIALLKSQIAQAEASIKAKKVAISRLTDDIVARQSKINLLDDKILREQDALGELLRKTREMDRATLVEVALESATLSDIFHNVDDFSLVQKAVHQSFLALRGAQDQAAIEKAGLEDKQAKELDAKKAIELDQQRIQKKEAERKVILNINKNQEQAYQAILKERQKRAAQIRAALFALRDTAAIPFEKALEYATAASAKTGVRPAFLLATLKQESNLGENVGSCFVTNVTTGAGVGANTGTPFAKVMNPTRDVPIFLAIMAGLGRDPFTTRVSCPQAIGWGGAMGPSQFIPSTWQLHQSEIAALVGKSVPDPWDPKDAFMASALYLSNLGAISGSYSAELNAACQYYSGRTCKAGPGSSYGASVMAKAADIQLNMIEPLQNN